MKSALCALLLGSALVTALPSRVLHAQTAASPSDAMTYDVRNGDQTGKLMLKETEMAFESLTDAKHSRTWKYADIRSIEKPKSELRVRPFKGSRYDFQFKDKKLRDQLYAQISQRVVAARQGGRK